MRDINIPQTLIIDPETGFEELAQTMQKLGWQRSGRIHVAPLILREPENASWTWQGSKPFAIYTYNPIAHLRVLDIATLPPVFRRPLYDKLPVLSEQQISHLFFSDNAKKRLLGLWAAQETERIDLIIQSERLMNDPDEVVSEQARAVTQKLQRINEARTQTLVNLQILIQAAPELIKRLDDSNFVATLKPSRADCEKLFDKHLADIVCKTVDDYYSDNIKLNTIAADAEIKVNASPAGLFRWANELSNKFPGAYRDIAGWMNPSQIWLTWTITSGTTVRYDGLTWVDSHWVWLPKIYRVLAPYCLNGCVNQAFKH